MRDNKKALPHSAKSKHGRRHHWLLSAKLLFTCDTKADATGEHEMNITITNDRLFVTANMIGQAQRSLQEQLFDILRDPTLKILNAHIQSVNYLGEMTKEEFYTPPLESEASAGEAVAEPVAATPVIVQDAFSA